MYQFILTFSGGAHQNSTTRFSGNRAQAVYVLTKWSKAKGFMQGAIIRPNGKVIHL